MACLYKRARSPFWWVEYIDLAGVRRQESTKYRHAVIADTRKARQLRVELSEGERSPLDKSEMWAAWVPRFMDQRYGHTPVTLRRYQNSWRNITAFLGENNIVVPRQLNRDNVRAFVDWRQERHVKAGCYECCKNTALHEVKLLRIVMFEAVQSGFAMVNPCAKLGIRPDRAPRKPRITDAQHQKILQALAIEPEWMRVSYEIAWEQGCRISETCLDIPSQVDIARGIIRFRTKGNKTTLAEFPLSRRLVPLFESLIRSGRRETFVMPDMPGKEWWRFFKRLKLVPCRDGIPDGEPVAPVSFHCTRVTFITRCRENGIHKDDVMRLVGHADDLVHAIYPRLTATDALIRAARDQMG